MADPDVRELNADRKKRRKAGKKDPEAPKPAPSAFMLYSNHRREELKTDKTSTHLG